MTFGGKAGDTVYVTNNQQQIGRLDLATNEVVDVVHTGVTFTDLALNENGDLYGATFDELYKIDPTTGNTTHVGSFGSHGINGLGFDGSGNLYASNYRGGFYQVDINNGSLTHVAGTAGFRSSGDVVWDEDQGSFFGSDRDGNLWSLGPNGQSNQIGNTGVGDLYGMYMDDGKLFAISSEFELYELNQTNASTTHIDRVEGFGGHLWGAASNPDDAIEELPANNAPKAVNDHASTVTGRKVGVRVLNNDSDPDGDTVRLISTTQGENGRVVRNNNGTFGDTSDDRLMYIPNEGFTGTDSFTYRIGDGRGGFDTATVDVVVEAGNSAPVAVDDHASTTAGQKVGVRVLNNDSDPDGDTVRLISTTQGANGRLVRNNNGTFGDTSDDRLMYIPNEGFIGTDHFTYRIGDGRGGFDTATVDVVVNPGDTPTPLPNPEPEPLPTPEPTVDLAIDYEATNVTETRYSSPGFNYDSDIAFPYDVMRYDVTITNESNETATGITANAIVPENIDLWEPGQTVSDTGFSWNEYFDFSPYVWKGSFDGSPEFVDSTNGSVSITDSGTGTVGQRLLNETYGLAEGSVAWELGDSLAPGESATLSFYGMRELKDGYDYNVGTQFQTTASIEAIDQRDTDLSNNVASTRSWWISPIAFDLDGDGVKTISINQGVQFDMEATGTKVTTGWLSGEDAFLATDDNGNGIIDDRSELFGGAVGEGFGELATFDSNGDAQVNALDDRFSELLVWQDANENGLTDAGELISLESAGIASISTEYTDVFSTDAQGNILGEFSTATRTDGSALEVVDAYFQVEA